MTPTETIQKFLDEIKAHDEASYGSQVQADDPNCGHCGNGVLVRGGDDFESGKDWCDDCTQSYSAFSRTALPKAGKVIALLMARLDRQTYRSDEQILKEIVRILEGK